MDGECREWWGLTGLEYATWLRENEIAGKVDKAVRERSMWLAATAELRETKEVERTGPASPAPCLQGRREGEGTTRELRELREHLAHFQQSSEFRVQINRFQSSVSSLHQLIPRFRFEFRSIDSKVSFRISIN